MKTFSCCLALLAVALLSSCGNGPDDSICGTVHMPKSGQCPAGYSAVPKMFSRNGHEYSGCTDTTGSKANCLDELRPGESTPLHMEVQ